MASITLKAPAKINLFLEVLKKRPDGYHEIETILQEIDLADNLTLKETSSPEIIIQCPNPHIPTDSRNLAYKAAFLLKKYIREKKRGVIISIAKNIPIAAGLGGGSSDAAATLKSLNRLWKLNLDTRTLSNLAQEIGMDVPFFIQGGLGLGRGRGEKVSPLKPLPETWFILTIPPLKVSTAWVYSHLIISSLTRKIKENKMILKAIQSGDIVEVGRQLFNRLEEVTMKRHRELAYLKESILSTGAKGALMSGSGPVVFGLFSSRREARIAQDALAKNKEEIYVVKNGRASWV